MTLKIAIQMDPIETLHVKGDTSFAIALEAQARGYEIFVYVPEALAMRDGVVSATGRVVKLKDKEGAHFTAKPEETRRLDACDVILMRQDPPFDMQYVSATYMLERVAKHALVVNAPDAVRDMPEKIFAAAHFASLMPPTLVSSQADDIRAFRRETGAIMLKEPHGGGGTGIFHFAKNDKNFEAVLDYMLAQPRRTPLIAQAYLPDIKKGDKRIIMIDGKACAALNRVPTDNEARANLHVGGSSEPAPLTKRDEDICAALGDTLARAGIVFAGIDVIGGFLTEINITSPTCFREVAALGGPNLSALFWDAVEARLPK